MENIFSFIDKKQEITKIQIKIHEFNSEFEIEKKVAENKFSRTLFIYAKLVLSIKSCLRISSVLILDAIILISNGDLVELSKVKEIIDLICDFVLKVDKICCENTKIMLDLMIKLSKFISDNSAKYIEKMFLRKAFSYDYPSMDLKIYLDKVFGKNFSTMIEKVITVLESNDLDTNQFRSLQVNSSLFNNN